MPSILSTPAGLPCTAGKLHLPFPSGKYSVIGYHDIMTGIGKEDGVFLRLLYPAANQNLDLSSTHAQWPNWYPNPNYKSALGTIFPPRMTNLVRVVQYFGTDLHIPILPEVKLFQRNSTAGEQSWPVIIFSHGLSSNRTTYSDLCCQFASLGFVVAVIEHRDASAYATMYQSPEGKDGFDWLPYVRMSDYGPFQGDVHRRARLDQIRLRVQEMSRAVDLLQALNEGLPVQNALENEFDYAQFRGQIDLGVILAAGHSFGGATALFGLAADPRLKIGLCFDAWMYSVRDLDVKKVKQPVLFINMDNFHSDESLLKIRDFVTPKAEEGEDRKVFKIKNSRHTDISDFPMLIHTYPRWVTSAINWIVPLISKITPFAVHEATLSLSMDFVNKHCNIEIANSPQFPEGIELEEGIILKDETLQKELNQEMVEIGRE